MGPSLRFLALVPALALGATGCLARGQGTLHRQTSDDAGPSIDFDAGTISDAAGELPPTDPHAVLGVDPPHGPFNGGQLAMVRGNGFTSDARVWFGSTEVPKSDVVPIDPGRVQVVVPPGKAGAVDVSVQNGSDTSTRGTLTGGYTYDSFYADPASGPTSGGTLVTLHGDGTKWDQGTDVRIDLKPCQNISVKSPTEITCSTPPDTPGAKTVRVTTSNGTSTDVLEAFTYGNSDNGFKGGMSGAPLKDHLEVLVLGDYTGNAIPGATVIAGDDLATAKVQHTDSAGVAQFQASGLGPKRSVTVAMKCFQPQTFVDVPVDTLTVYLDPVLAPSCASQGDPPPVGGTPGYAAGISGQLIWTGGQEFQKAGWTNVPKPKSSDEKLVAYVLPLRGDPTQAFQLPPVSQAVTPQASGDVGYAYSLSTSPGNRSLYAVAGIENDALSPPQFFAYAMGLVKGVAAKPGLTTTNVYIPMDVPLDHAMKIDVKPPQTTPRGPDRVRAGVAVRVGELGYATLPGGQVTRLLPVSSAFDIVGVPPLVGSLAGTQYISTALAGTGATNTTPLSVIGAVLSTTTDQTVNLDGFVEIPKLTQPPGNSGWNAQDLAVDWLPGGASVDLTVYDIESGAGLVDWTVIAPGSDKSVHLPDLASLSSDLGFGVIPGPVSITVSAAHINSFDYGTLTYHQVGKYGWDAYARDVFNAHF